MHSNMQPYEVARIRRTSAIDTMMIKNDEQTLIYVSDDGEKKKLQSETFFNSNVLERIFEILNSG